MFSAMVRMRSDWARMPEAATCIDVVKSMILYSFLQGAPMAVRISDNAFE